MTSAAPNAPSGHESTYAWLRLAVSLSITALSGVGMYAAAVALPAIQAEFGVDRSGASLPYAALMIGFGLGGILMGRLSDRFGVMVPVLLGATAQEIVGVDRDSLLLDVRAGTFGTPLEDTTSSPRAKR